MDYGAVSSKDFMDIDQILPLIGECGKYQRLLDALFCFINFPLTYQLLIMYFSTLSPPWMCVRNSSICLLNGTMSSNDDRRCSMPRNEWEYTEARSYSLVTEFDIHCENEWLVGLINSVYFIGWGVGSIILGWIADKYGRKTVLFPSVALILAAGFCTAFMPNVYLITVCRFVVGCFTTGGTLQMFIIISEIVGSKHRAFAGLSIYLAGSVGLCILTLKAYFIREWKLLNVVCTAPYLLFLAFYRVVPESVRWLQQQGKSREALKTIGRIAYYNKKDLSPHIKLSSSKHTTDANPLDLFRTRKIALSSCIQGFIWMTTSICFYSLAFAANDLDGSPYRDQLILIVTELPAVFISVYCMNRVGRKTTALVSLFFGGASSIAIAFIPTNSSDLKIACGILGKFTIATALNCLYTWSLELYPTNLRAEGMGLLQVTAHIGSGSAPWISENTYSLFKGAPFIIMGISPVISSVLGMLLPETKSKKLLDDTQEYERTK